MPLVQALFSKINHFIVWFFFGAFFHIFIFYFVFLFHIFLLLLIENRNIKLDNVKFKIYYWLSVLLNLHIGFPSVAKMMDWAGLEPAISWLPGSTDCAIDPILSTCSKWVKDTTSLQHATRVRHMSFLRHIFLLPHINQIT